MKIAIESNAIYDRQELIEIFGSSTTLHRAQHRGLKVRKPTGGKVYCLGSEILRFMSMENDNPRSDFAGISPDHLRRVNAAVALIHGRR